MSTTNGIGSVLRGASPQQQVSTHTLCLLQHISHLQRVFEAADADGSGSLDAEEWVQAFKGHLADDSDVALRRLFLACDAKCRGRVTWDEFSGYLLLQRSQQPAANDPAAPPTSSCGDTSDWQQQQQQQHASSSSSRRGAAGFRPLTTSSTAGPTAPSPPAAGGAASGSRAAALRGSAATGSRGAAGAFSCLLHGGGGGKAPHRWFTASTAGVVDVWAGKGLAHMRALQTGLPGVTAAACLPHSGVLALGSYCPHLLLLDAGSGRHAGTIAAATSSAALSLAAWTAGHSGDASSSSLAQRVLLGVGDADGSISLLQCGSSIAVDKPRDEWLGATQLWRAASHKDWVVSLALCPDISSLAAASLDKTVSLTDVERSIAVRHLTGHTKGVHCVAWSRLFRVLASGGADGRVTLWNPFSCRPLGALAGHAAPLVGLVDNEADMQLVSASEDGVVKVWDLRNQQCLQTLQLQQQQQQAASTTGCAASGAGSSKRRLSVLGWDPEHRVLVAGGASGISSWQQATAAAAAGCAARMRHAARAPASWVGFVPCVGEVVSTDSAATVCCWDLASGQLLHSFERAHGSCRISTATLDADCRRLITGAEDGSVKVWNLRTGTLLSSAGPSSGSSSGSGNSGSGNSSSSPAGALGAEVTGLAVCSSTAGNGQAAACIVATGWDRQVTWFADVPGRRRCPQLRAAAGPSSDVLAAAAMPGYPSLATACYNGEIWVWNLDSAAVRRKLAPPSLAHTPEHERAVEALAFLHADLRHVLVAGGADGVLRFWDCFTGACLEHDARSAAGITSLAVSPDNTRVVVGDTDGWLAVWDISTVHGALLPAPASRGGGRAAAASVAASGAGARCADAAASGAGWPPPATPGFGSSSSSSSSSRPAMAGGACGRASAVSVCCAPRPARGIVPAAGMRAHGDSITALAWLPPGSGCGASRGSSGSQLLDGGTDACPAACAAPGSGWIVSAGLDSRLVLWTADMQQVGEFGAHIWALAQPSSWQQHEPPGVVAERVEQLQQARRRSQRRRAVAFARDPSAAAPEQEDDDDDGACGLVALSLTRPAAVHITALDAPSSVWLPQFSAIAGGSGGCGSTRV